MKSKFMSTVFIGIFWLTTAIANIANASLILASDWHLTTDGFSGMKISWNSSDIAFAVARTTTFDAVNEYEAIAGWKFATYAEYVAATNIEVTGGSGNLVYWNQGGWKGYLWEGSTRFLFKFADSNFANSYMFQAGGSENIGWNGVAGREGYAKTHYTQNNLNTRFAGFVMVRGGLAKTVPEPSTLAIFALGIMGLVSRRIKKQS